MAEHPNAVSVWRSFEAWNSGDLDVIRGYFTDDAVLHFAGNNPMSGTYRGGDAVMDALARASQGWGTHADVDSVLASDDHTMVFYHTTDEREGAVMAMKIDADGNVTEAWFLGSPTWRKSSAHARCGKSVIVHGADVMDRIFPGETKSGCLVTRLVTHHRP